MKLAKEFNHNFDNGDFRLYDSNNNEIYFETSNGYWHKKEYDENNNVIYYEDSMGYWEKLEFDENNNVIYYEDSMGYWHKKEYDENNNRIYFENSYGAIINNRPKCDKVVEIEGIKYKLVKI